MSFKSASILQIRDYPGSSQSLVKGMEDGLKFECIFSIATTKEKEGTLDTQTFFKYSNHTGEFPNQHTFMVKGRRLETHK